MPQTQIKPTAPAKTSQVPSDTLALAADDGEVTVFTGMGQSPPATPAALPVGPADVPTTWHPSALPLLPGVAAPLSDFLTLLNHDVRHRNVPAHSVEVRGTTDPEDETSQVLVRLWICGWSEGEVRRYYADFGRVVDEWTATLSADRREEFTNGISFQARRAPDA